MLRRTGKIGAPTQVVPTSTGLPFCKKSPTCHDGKGETPVSTSQVKLCMRASVDVEKVMGGA